METEKVYAMPFAKIYPILVAKAVGKGRTQAEVDEIIGWLTGYSACGVKQEGIEEPLMKEIRYLESWWMSWLRAKRWRRSSGQTNEEKQPITHRQRMWYNLLKTLYGKDKHDESSGYYETPCCLCQWL